MGEVEFKVNIINQLMLLKNSTFKDKYCFVDETIQNAQRAGAKTVYVTKTQSEEDYSLYDLTFENNGDILLDFQKLFSIAESGWEDDKVKAENPFGIGFFSNIAVTDLIDVYSGNQMCTIDLQKIFAERNIAMQTVECEHVAGFKLVLRNISFDYNFRSSEVENRVRLLGKYVHELDIYLYDELLEKQDVNSIPKGMELVSVLIPKTLGSGWIGLADGYGSKVNLFYKGRLITEISSLSYLKGEIHITDGMLNLTAPDRKDIIRDAKYADFMTSLKDLVKDFIIQNINLLDLQKYEDAIRYNIDLKDFTKNYKFNVVNSKDIEDMASFAQSLDEKFMNDYTEKLQLDSTVLSLNESAEQDCEVESTVSTETFKREEYSGGYYGGGGSSYQETKAEKEFNKYATRDFIKSNMVAVWVKNTDIRKYSISLELCSKYDIQIIVTKTEYEERVLRNINIKHVTDFEGCIEVIAKITTENNRAKNDRVVMLLELVSKLAGFKENMFVLGDLTTRKVLTIGDEVFDDTYKDKNPIRVVYSKELNKVLVDRSTLKNVRFSNGTNNRITIQDFKYVCMNLPILVKELNLVPYNDTIDINKILVGLGTRVKTIDDVEELTEVETDEVIEVETTGDVF